jgi:hypothetical protein
MYHRLPYIYTRIALSPKSCTLGVFGRVSRVLASAVQSGYSSWFQLNGSSLHFHSAWLPVADGAREPSHVFTCTHFQDAF